MRNYRLYPLFTLLLAALLTSGCNQAPQPPAVVETVIQTIEVEVTRNVEVTRLVESIREVMVTQVVEHLVTVTPLVPEATPSVPALGVPTAALANTTPQVTPQEKYTGYTPIFVHNKISDKIDIYIAGPDAFNLALWGGDQTKIWAREGAYIYTVWINGQEAYQGKFNIVSADKYDLLLHEKKAVLWIP